MKIDERLPASVMVNEERCLQRSWFGEVNVLRGGINQVPIRVASTRPGEPQNVVRTLLAACQKDDSEVGRWALPASALHPRHQRVLVGFVIEQLRADALLGIRVDGFGGLVDLEVRIELLAAERELKEAIGIERVRGDVDAGIPLAVEKRDRASVAIRSNDRMHDDFGERLRVQIPRRRNGLES